MTKWTTSKLGEACEIIKRGVSPKYIEEGGICVINQKCIRNHEINYTLSRRHNVSVKSVNLERIIQIGDVLVNSTGTGTLGRVAQVRTKPEELTTVDTHVTIVRPKKNIFHDDFFGYMLIKIEDEIAESGAGASGQTELARTVLENKFHVSFPESIETQKLIVAKLDQAFADIEKAVSLRQHSLT
jgi:type I restriction enzyme S subunit